MSYLEACIHTCVRHFSGARDRSTLEAKRVVFAVMPDKGESREDLMAKVSSYMLRIVQEHPNAICTFAVTFLPKLERGRK